MLLAGEDNRREADDRRRQVFGTNRISLTWGANSAISTSLIPLSPPSAITTAIDPVNSPPPPITSTSHFKPRLRPRFRWHRHAEAGCYGKLSPCQEQLENRIKITKADAIKPLISIVSSIDPQLQEYGMTTILNMLLCDENKEDIAFSGAIKPLVRALRGGTSTARSAARYIAGVELDLEGISFLINSKFSFLIN